MTLREAVGLILEGWTLPDDVRKILETAYFSEPQRQWVGLTEQERNDIEDYCEMIIGKPAFDTIEAKLKEKNT